MTTREEKFDGRTRGVEEARPEGTSSRWSWRRPRPQAAYLVAAMLVRLGRTEELARRAPELKRIVGDDLQHSICLQLRLEGKEGGCAGPID